jgi:glycosyltransferase involved in cell wall biosynthesis
MCATDPLISVVIPAYNAAAYIGPTLDSVFAQTFTDYEVIVVNDGSPDTPAMESALAPYRGKIRYIRQENRGPSGARNRAIKDARGTYIAFLDSDDIWLPEHLARQVEALRADPTLGLAYANAVHIENDRAVDVAFDNTTQSLPVDFDALLEERSTVSTSSAVASRQALVAAGLFDEELKRCEDYDMWLRMAYSGVRMTFSREIQIGHRLANGLAANGDLMKQALIQVYEKTASTRALSEKQARVVREKINTISTALQFERAKQMLLDGKFDESLECLCRARALSRSWKLRAAELGLRSFPGFLQTIYRSRLRSVERQKRAKRARSLEKAGFGGGRIPGFKIAADRPVAL